MTPWEVEGHTGVFKVNLPGCAAVLIDIERRLIVVDGRSGTFEDAGPTEFRVLDLRDGVYGDFHRLQSLEDCFDPVGCADAGQHIAVDHTVAGVDA